MEVSVNDLSYEFQTVWFAFRSTKAWKFLFLYLKKEEHDLRLRLENTSPEELGRVQGMVKQVQKMLTLLDRQSADDPMKELVTHLERK